MVIFNTASFTIRKCTKSLYRLMSRSSNQLMIMQQPDESKLIEMIRSTIPELNNELHKGQCGRIAVIGGCEEYTGAPYFAGYSALRVGSDLSHIFCTRSAAIVIKSYSPELIVHPTLAEEGGSKSIRDWLDRMHAVVIGPGLGRDQNVTDHAKGILKDLCNEEQHCPVVIDADGLFLLSSGTDLVQDKRHVILTPNNVEFERLCQLRPAVNNKDLSEVERVKRLSESLGGVTVVKKGAQDIISDGSNVLVCVHQGSARRCGGQGDLLSGSLAVFAYWAQLALIKSSPNELLKTYGPTLCSSYAACLLTRDCARRAYQLHGRSTTTTDLISNIHASFEGLFNK